ncbi:hypothetical protein DUI87_25008 [Hirundo rustica rustica]|uniref:Uncharacterized protein n=1 Tax=Hirundo rustica rustica TaxID=333673 RepID=A0A3M0JJC1_HIRRU|nr:hypothetical protein DUI87_25008 [Hirundo rustica rustica]
MIFSKMDFSHSSVFGYIEDLQELTIIERPTPEEIERLTVDEELSDIERAVYLLRVLETVQISPPGVTDVVLWNRDGPVESPVVVDGSSLPPGIQWKNRIPCVLQSQFLSSWEQLAPPPLCGASPDGMMECVMSLVGPNGPLSEAYHLEDGGVVKEIRNTAPPGFIGWAIIRRHLPPSPLELQEKAKTSPKKQLSTDEIEYTFLGYITQDKLKEASLIPERNSPLLSLCDCILLISFVYQC